MTSKRSDAENNREAILTAADVVFARHGVSAPLDMVIKEAGVGRATLYRNFVDRTALVIALLNRELDLLEQQAGQLVDARTALFALLHFSAAHMTDRSALFDHLATIRHDLPEMVSAQARLRALFQSSLDASIAAGACRDDITPEDIVLISGMIGGAIRGRGSRDRKQASDRAIALLIEGLMPV